MGNDGEISDEIRRGHDATRLKRIGMKGEQGVRDPAGVGVGHGRVALDRWCISFKCMYAGRSTAACSSALSSHICHAVPRRYGCLSHRHCRRCCRRRHLPRCCPERFASSRSFLLLQLLNLLFDERRTLNSSFLLDICICYRILHRWIMRNILGRCDASSLYWYPNCHPSCVGSGL